MDSQGQIYIPGIKQNNGRILELKSFQIMELQDYLSEVRPKLIPTILSGEPTNQLFISIKGNNNIKNSSPENASISGRAQTYKFNRNI